MSNLQQNNRKIKAVFFDFMGTCLDWCSSVETSLPQSIQSNDRRSFALRWRIEYFRENEKRLKHGLPVENFDITLSKTLDQILLKSNWDSELTELSLINPDSLSAFQQYFSFPQARLESISSWHHQKAWPDVSNALQSIRDQIGCEMFVHGNGTTRLQLDLIKSSGLRYDLLFSSELLEEQKPAASAYLKALRLVKYEPHECVTVAAHISDLRGAKAVGMKTIYIHRSTDDIDENLEGINEEFDHVLPDMKELCTTIQRLSK